jgi:hypothetical protein
MQCQYSDQFGQENLSLTGNITSSDYSESLPTCLEGNLITLQAITLT